MKKSFLLIAAAMLTLSASAQTVTESKTFDNFYIGINGGVATKTTGHSWLSDLDPNAGLRIGRWFTPVYGLAAEGTAYFSNKPYPSTGTAVRYTNVSLLNTINLSNWFGGYKGTPRCFEVIAVAGLGWGHGYGVDGANAFQEALESNDDITSKLALDFAFNLGANKAWQIYVEPSINYLVSGVHRLGGSDQTQYNLNRSFVQLNAGVVYKFKNSNGTHNFTIAQLRDQGEIDGLNAQINSLRSDLNGKDAQLAAKDRQISDLQKALDECNAKPKQTYVKPETATNLQPTVLFRQGKSTIDAAQYAPIELIANYMKNNKNAKVEIKGYASPEGSKELNQKLSEKRAEAVKNALVKNYKIDANRLTTKGMGATDKLFKQVEFNRVATFNDENSVD